MEVNYKNLAEGKKLAEMLKTCQNEATQLMIIIRNESIDNVYRVKTGS